ncbi:MAG: methyltransferase domain-containing protein [Caldilineaceae bacterium]
MNIKQLFNQAAQTYDQTRRQYIPCFDDFYGTALACIPTDRGDSLRVLDLGAGTGLLAALVAQAFPQAHITLADISEAMLAQAAARFGDHSERIRYVVLDYAAEPIAGIYDVVISALSLHHTPGPQLKAVFQKIYAALAANGCFINADQVLGPTPAIEQRYEEIWQRQVRDLGCSQADLAIAIVRMKADRTSPLHDQLAWLEEAGFQEVNCWYKNYRFAVYSGQKICNHSPSPNHVNHSLDTNCTGRQQHSPEKPE